MDKILLERIKQLPPLPESCQQIENVYHDENSQFDDLVKILEKDPMLTADLLKAANSPLYGFSKEVTDLGQAVSLFGMGTVRGFALATIIKKSFKLDLTPYGLSNSTFSKLSWMQYGVMLNWCLRYSPKLLKILTPAAFLVELGKVIISQCVIEHEALDSFKAALASKESSEEAEKAVCGSSTPEVSGTMFENWKFDDTLVNVIRYCDNVDEAPEEIKEYVRMLAIVRKVVTLDAEITDKSLSEAIALVQQYGLPEDEFIDSVKKLQID